MAYEVPAALIGGGAALIGGAMGTIGTLIAARQQHQRDARAAREAEGRQRSRESAAILEELIESLAHDLTEKFRMERRRDFDEAVWGERSDRIQVNGERAAVLISNLPEPWSERLAEGWKFMRWADDMATDHYQSAASIVVETSRYMRRAVGCFLRNDEVPPPITQRWVEYRTAYTEAEDEKRWEFAQEIGEDENARAEWLDKHPAVKELLAASGLPEYVGEGE